MKNQAKLLTIAHKDLTQSFRSAFALAFMFGVPLLITGMFYFMFGGTPEGETQTFTLAPARVQIANLDQGSPDYPPAPGSQRFIEPQDDLAVDLSSAVSLGAVFVQVLRSPTFADWLEVSLAPDAPSARAAVDDQTIKAAIILPENFTQALVEPGTVAVVEIYQDPAQPLAAAVVRAILNRLIDQAAAPKIGLEVVSAQLNAAGLELTAAQGQDLAGQLAAWSDSAGRASAPIAPQPVTAGAPAQNEAGLSPVSIIMGGMLVFFAFFTGANSIQSVLVEEDKGTLARLFTTPTSAAAVLGGKFLAAALTVAGQVSGLLLLGRLVFGIHWGHPVSLGLVALGLVASAASLGIFVISLLKDVQQTGVVLGGGLTMLGMLGIANIFTINSPSALVADRLSLLAPQGWAVQGLRLALEGADPAAVLPVVLGMLAWSAAFFTIGVWRFQKRFA